MDDLLLISNADAALIGNGEGRVYTEARPLGMTSDDWRDGLRRNYLSAERCENED